MQRIALTHVIEGTPILEAEEEKRDMRNLYLLLEQKKSKTT